MKYIKKFNESKEEIIDLYEYIEDVFLRYSDELNITRSYEALYGKIDNDVANDIAYKYYNLSIVKRNLTDIDLSIHYSNKLENIEEFENEINKFISRIESSNKGIEVILRKSQTTRGHVMWYYFKIK